MNQKVQSMYDVDGEIIQDGPFKGIKLVAQQALGVKSPLVNAYSKNGNPIGVIHRADVDRFEQGDGKCLQPVGGWENTFSTELKEKLGISGLSPKDLPNIRVFSGMYPCGIVYADRFVEEHGDYKRLAFLPYNGMVLQIEKDCPPELEKYIRNSIKQYEGKTELQTSSSGQMTKLTWENEVNTPEETRTLDQLFEMAGRGAMPEDFTEWDLATPQGWTLAHEAVANGWPLPDGFRQWSLADNAGWSVAHEAATKGLLPEDFVEWKIKEALSKKTVLDVAESCRNISAEEAAKIRESWVEKPKIKMGM